MFFNQSGRVRGDAERFAEKALRLTDEEVASLDERLHILKDALNSLSARLETIPERDAKAMQCLLYTEMTEVVFNARLSIEARIARQQIKQASSLAEKKAALHHFQNIMEDVAMLHAVA